MRRFRFAAQAVRSLHRAEFGLGAPGQFPITVQTRPSLAASPAAARPGSAAMSPATTTTNAVYGYITARSTGRWIVPPDHSFIYQCPILTHTKLYADASRGTKTSHRRRHFAAKNQNTMA